MCLHDGTPVQAEVAIYGALLAVGPSTVSDLVEVFPYTTQFYFQERLKALIQLGLVRVREDRYEAILAADGKVRRVRINDGDRLDLPV